MKDLRVSGVAKAFGPQPVLRGVDLAVPHGSFTAILGASGSGKTTLLRIVAGFERPDDGVVQLGEEVVDDAGHRFVPSERRRIGYVPQEGALFPHLSVGRNVAFGLPRGPDRRRRVDELLELVGLSGYRRRYPHQLSGGQQQRVALARALAIEPEIVLLDEPFASLDAAMRSSVRGDVLGVLRQAGTTSILVTHDQDEALSMADQVAVLRQGVIAQLDTPAALYGRPGDVELAQFLGESNVLEGEVENGTARTALGRLPVESANGRRERAGPGPRPARTDQAGGSPERRGGGHRAELRVLRPRRRGAGAARRRGASRPGRAGDRRRAPRARAPGGAVGARGGRGLAGGAGGAGRHGRIHRITPP